MTSDQDPDTQTTLDPKHLDIKHWNKQTRIDPEKKLSSECSQTKSEIRTGLIAKKIWKNIFSRNCTQKSVGLDIQSLECRASVKRTILPRTDAHMCTRYV